jgi:NADPH-dependent 7-cyano-7-deazaguanine reductase QueF
MGEDKIDYNKLNDKEYKVIQNKLILMCLFSRVVDISVIRIYYFVRIKVVRIYYFGLLILIQKSIFHSLD